MPPTRKRFFTTIKCAPRSVAPSRASGSATRTTTARRSRSSARLHRRARRVRDAGTSVPVALPGGNVELAWAVDRRRRRHRQRPGLRQARARRRTEGTSLADDARYQTSPARRRRAPASPSSTSRRSASGSSGIIADGRPGRRQGRVRDGGQAVPRPVRCASSRRTRSRDELDHSRTPSSPSSSEDRGAPSARLRPRGGTHPMAVRIRLTRVGAKKQPTYRVVVADSPQRARQPRRSRRSATTTRAPSRSSSRSTPTRRRPGSPRAPSRPTPSPACSAAPASCPPSKSGEPQMAAKELVEYVARSLVDDPDAVKVTRSQDEEGDRHRAARRRGRHGQGHRPQRQRRQGAADAAQGDRGPRGQPVQLEII